ncbi:hypothetical protein NPIL_97871 [Nephila pilipes]|uniref:Uncharacterized protein n=1 Tax=Nephila pilipes TaxID=299642 RepID=A0A8X6R341_NEPPI|nr:hypothetical protein NPIL_97871 [Nephila pilipes]
MSRKKVFKTAEEAVEYLFSDELESEMIVLPPEVDEFTDEEGFDDSETLDPSVRDVICPIIPKLSCQKSQSCCCSTESPYRYYLYRTHSPEENCEKSKQYLYREHVFGENLRSLLRSIGRSEIEDTTISEILMHLWTKHVFTLKMKHFPARTEGFQTLLWLSSDNRNCDKYGLRRLFALSRFHNTEKEEI